MAYSKKVAIGARRTSVKAGFCLIFALAMAACSSLPQPPARAEVYDFGPGQQTAPAPAAPAAARAIVLADVVSTGMPDADSGLNYRLAYTNVQQLRPYRDARWSQPPAQLLTQALRERLGQGRAVLTEGGMGVRLADGARPDVLRLQLEEFSQVFDAPQTSHALVRLRASLARSTHGSEQLLAQRLFVVQRPAATPDAVGGAKALAEAAGQLADEVAQWLDGK